MLPQCLLAYSAAYRHAEAWGVTEDLFGGLGSAQGGCSGPSAAAVDGGASASIMRPFAQHPQSGDRWAGFAANTPQPQLLAARTQLRREIVDLCFRRPNIAPEAGYFASGYIMSTVSLELEGSLLEKLTSAAAREERQALIAAHATATAAAATAASTAAPKTEPEEAQGGEEAEPPPPPPLPGLPWSLGVPPAVLYGGVLQRAASSRGLMQEGVMLPGVGAAAAAVPGLVRAVAANLAEVHQLRHDTDLAEVWVLGSFLPSAHSASRCPLSSSPPGPTDGAAVRVRRAGDAAEGGGPPVALRARQGAQGHHLPGEQRGGR